MSINNKVDKVDSTNTFNSYKINNESQENAVKKLKKVCEYIKETKADFKQARAMFIHGGPGLGKTHLLNSIVNECQEFKDNICFLRSNIDSTFGMIYDGMIPEHKTILMLDDMFSEYHSIDQLHPATDIRSLINLIYMAYENKKLLIMNSNFNLVDNIIPMIERVDKQGRITSRLKEMMALSGSIEIIGQDYREILSTQKEHNIFA